MLRVIFKGTKLLGYVELCPKQEVVVRQFAEWKDVFVISPMGSDKSIYYLVSQVVDSRPSLQTVSNGQKNQRGNGASWIE